MIVGTPVFNGVVTAKARVVTDLQDATNIQVSSRLGIVAFSDDHGEIDGSYR